MVVSEKQICSAVTFSTSALCELPLIDPLSGSAAVGAALSNPPTPERSVGAGGWVNKLLVVKKGFNKYYYKYYSRPGGPGG